MVEIQIKEELDKWTLDSLKREWKSVFLNDEQIPSKRVNIIEMLFQHYRGVNQNVTILPRTEFYSVESLRRELKARGIVLRSFSSKNELQQQLQKVIFNLDGDQTQTKEVDGEKVQVIQCSEGEVVNILGGEGEDTNNDKDDNNNNNNNNDIDNNSNSNNNNNEHYHYDDNNNGDIHHSCDEMIRHPPDENAAKSDDLIQIQQTPPHHNSKQSILTPPNSRSKVRSRVLFDHVEIREYKRTHAGACGIPTYGAFPLGLAWEYDKDNVQKLGIDNFEENLKRKRPVGDATYLPESQRRIILRDHENVFAKGEITQEKKELNQIRKAREDVGCKCSAKTAGKSGRTRKSKKQAVKMGCNDKGCSCYENGVECIEACQCKCDGCENPHNPKKEEEEEV